MMAVARHCLFSDKYKTQCEHSIHLLNVKLVGASCNQ
jgi:hypothetical protein